MNAKPEARQTDCEKIKKTFLNSDAIWYKNELFFQFYKWVKREETNATIDRLVCRQANDQSKQAGQELTKEDLQILRR